MTKTEWLQVHSYLAAGCGKELNADGLAVYYDLLGDLPFAVAKLAAQRVLIRHRYATFPSIAELREDAVSTMRGQVTELSAAEAWSLAWAAAGNMDPESDGSVARALEGLPPLVVEAIKAFGVEALCYGREPVGVVRAQFQRTFEQLAAREQRTALLPARTAEAIAANRPAQLDGILERIGLAQ